MSVRTILLRNKQIFNDFVFGDNPTPVDSHFKDWFEMVHEIDAWHILANAIYLGMILILKITF